MKYLTLGLVTLISFSCSSHKHHETLEVQTLGGRLRYINRSDLGGKISNHYPNRMNAYTKITQATFVKIGQLLRSKLEDNELRKKFLKCSNRFEIGQFIREHLSHEID